MKAISSVLAGFCIIEDKNNKQLIKVNDMSIIEPEIAHIISGAINDWEIVEKQDLNSILTEIREQHINARCLINVETCLSGVSEELQRDLLIEIDDLLKVSDSAISNLKAKLLRAPINLPDIKLHGLIKYCLSNGLGVTANILGFVNDSQPLLHRLTDIWISIPEYFFYEIQGGRQQLWNLAVNNGTILDTLLASSFQDIQNIWGNLAFSLKTPVERSCIIRITKEISTKLFPTHANKLLDASLISEHDIQLTKECRFSKYQADNYACHQSALKQIEAITSSISKGHDANAHKYLSDLISTQMSIEGGEDFLVKSLCNIAKQSAEMFRTDFEYECLMKAINIKPGDNWTRIQLADHYKRVGSFDYSINVLQKMDYNKSAIIKCSLADVYAHMGRFTDSIDIYNSFNEKEIDSTIRQAKADTLRKWGHFDEARQEYDQIIKQGISTDRAYAGEAEIEKKLGHLDQAQNIYKKLLRNQPLDNYSLAIYRMALVNVLVRIGDLTEAYKLIDSVVREKPFMQQAIILRAAIAGLLGEPEKAIKELPYLGQTKAYNEWVNGYVRGLLLLLLNRYSDAKNSIFQEVESRKFDADIDSMLRLSAAVYFLKDRSSIKIAEKTIYEIPNMKDAFADLIRSVLEYHIAIALRQKSQIQSLEKQLLYVKDKDIKELVTAIGQKNWSKVHKLEARALLRLAA